jgi:hypothetical protein
MKNYINSEQHARFLASAQTTIGEPGRTKKPALTQSQKTLAAMLFDTLDVMQEGSFKISYKALWKT